MLGQVLAQSTTGSRSLRVLLVDDQAVIGQGIALMLRSELDISFVHCQDATKAVEKALEIRPTVILQDMVMPHVDGLDLVREFRKHPLTRDVPIIVLSGKGESLVKAKAFAAGANDYMVKWPEPLEVIARLRYHSHGYLNLVERNEVWRRMVETQEALARELGEAAAYIRSLLPPRCESPVKIDWKFIPSASLGGDSFGYHWLDNDHLAIYLLDVCGHGVGSALLSISAIDTLRSRTLPDTNFFDPADVFVHLNNAFQMDTHGDKFFTAWYGVYDRIARNITYSSAGHPGPVLVSGDAGQGGRSQVQKLEERGMVIGGMPETQYSKATTKIRPHDRLYIFSDGVYEITRPDGTMWSYDDLVEFLAAPGNPWESTIDRLLQHARRLGGSDSFADDFSIIEVTFP